MTLKPMLAVEAQTINFPAYVSKKIDGLRSLGKDNQLLSRTLKLIPNKFVQSALGVPGMHGLDGEIVVGPPNAKNTMQASTSGLMSVDGEPDFTMYVFDIWCIPDTPYETRYNMLKEYFVGHGLTHPQDHRVKLLEQTIVNNQEELDAYEAKALAEGYEGVMVRAMDAPYKYGRSTAKQGYLLKVKRFKQSEARIIGAAEKMHNMNELEEDELGYAKRSTAQDGLIPADTLGALEVEDITSGADFSVGTGFDDKMRAELWALHKEGKLLGKIVTYKYFELGVVDKPRFPVFISLRDPTDMGFPVSKEFSIDWDKVPVRRVLDAESEPRDYGHHRPLAVVWKKSEGIPTETSNMSMLELIDLARTYYDISSPLFDRILTEATELDHRIKGLEK